MDWGCLILFQIGYLGGPNTVTEEYQNTLKLEEES